MNYQLLVVVFSDLSTATSANGKNWPTLKSRYKPPLKIPFIKATHHFYGCQLAIPVQLHSFLNWKLNAHTYVG